MIFGPTLHVAPLGGLGDREAHARDAGFVHQVDDELQFVQALEVGHLRRVAGLDERFESGLHQRARAAAEHGLFAEEIGLGLFLEGGFDHAGAGAADALGPGERDLLRLLAGVLIDGDERRHAFAFGVLAADDVAGAFRRDHDDVHVLRRDDGLEMDREAVAEEERLALGEIRRDVLLVGGGLLGVGQGDQDDVGALHGLGGVEDLEALFLRRPAGTCCRGRGR